MLSSISRTSLSIPNGVAGLSDYILYSVIEKLPSFSDVMSVLCLNSTTKALIKHKEFVRAIIKHTMGKMDLMKLPVNSPVTNCFLRTLVRSLSLPRSPRSAYIKHIRYILSLSQGCGRVDLANLLFKYDVIPCILELNKDSTIPTMPLNVANILDAVKTYPVEANVQGSYSDEAFAKLLLTVACTSSEELSASVMSFTQYWIAHPAHLAAFRLLPSRPDFLAIFDAPLPRDKRTACIVIRMQALRIRAMDKYLRLGVHNDETIAVFRATVQDYKQRVDAFPVPADQFDYNLPQFPNETVFWKDLERYAVWQAGTALNSILELF